MDRLEEKIGYSFHDRSLLLTALTHSSYANEKNNPRVQSYERQEFLGDSILGVTAAEFLFRHEPPLPEGQMTRLRAELVCEENLHKVADRLELSLYMRLGRGEQKTGGRKRASILADMVESIIAAIYLDSGMEEATAFIMRHILNDVRFEDVHSFKDYKTELQEQVQKNKGSVVTYEQTGESGPDHCKVFSFRVLINGQPAGEGSGRTKKEAEQQAAKLALENMENEKQ